jgi:hypothetical protein
MEPFRDRSAAECFIIVFVHKGLIFTCGDHIASGKIIVGNMV